MVVVSVQRNSDGDATSTTATSSITSITESDAGAVPESLSLTKPHRSSDSAFEAIVSASSNPGAALSYRDYKLLRQIGSGDIGTVYLCRLRGSSCASDYAMKVVDRDAVAMKSKTERAETEKHILKMLDHPFLPTLYAEFNVSNFSCIVMHY